MSGTVKFLSNLQNREEYQINFDCYRTPFFMIYIEDISVCSPFLFDVLCKLTVISLVSGNLQKKKEKIKYQILQRRKEENKLTLRI